MASDGPITALSISLSFISSFSLIRSCVPPIDATYPTSYIPFLPALPATCFTSCDVSSLTSSPSYLETDIKIILLIGRFTPIPIASVVTNTLVSLFKNSAYCIFLTSGGKSPYIILALIPFSE